MTIRKNMNKPSRRQGDISTWRRSFERYSALAAAEDLDRVARENYYQHAEHYLRLMIEAGAAA
jgi:hypothetical protein